MGCGSSKSRSRTDEDASQMDSVIVEELEPDYPAPKHPSSEKEAVFDTELYKEKDKKSSQIGGNFDSYESLVAALGGYSANDLDTARAIFVWLFHQDISNAKFPRVKDANTPRGYMKLIKLGKGTLEQFYAILCRTANIPCVILHGLGKGDDYVVGQTDTANMEGSWNAVYIDGSWRFVHLEWAFYQQKLGDQTRISSQDKIKRNKRAAINEFFWLIDPTKLIFFCCPNESQWQLLNIPWDLKSFFECPQLTEDYFTSGLGLRNTYKSIIKSRHGVCSIIFDHSESDRENMKLSGMISAKLNESINTYFKNHIITIAKESSKELFIRFPEAGVFYLSVIGGRHDSKTVAKFCLECSSVDHQTYSFPPQPENTYTIFPTLNNFGISSITPDEVIVYVKPRERKEFQISMSRDLNIRANLFHVIKDTESLRSFVDISKDSMAGEEAIVTVSVTIPDERHFEYSLHLCAFDSNNRGVTIATYLLVHHGWPYTQGKGRSRRMVPQDEDELRRSLRDATGSGNIKRLEDAVRQFQSTGLDDEGDMTNALNVLLRMHLDDLATATHSRDLKKITSAIERAEASVLAPVICKTREMEEALRVQAQLLRLNGVLHRVLALKPKTISEISSYPRPRVLVHNVMKATYRILGEPNINIQSWSSVKNLTKQIGANSIINRIRRFDIIVLTDTDVDDAQKYLAKTNKRAVRVVSAGAATFYVWSRDILSQYQRMSQDMQSSKNSSRLSQTTSHLG